MRRLCAKNIEPWRIDSSAEVFVLGIKVGPTGLSHHRKLPLDIDSCIAAMWILSKYQEVCVYPSSSHHARRILPIDYIRCCKSKSTSGQLPTVSSQIVKKLTRGETCTMMRFLLITRGEMGLNHSPMYNVFKQTSLISSSFDNRCREGSREIPKKVSTEGRSGGEAVWLIIIHWKVCTYPLLCQKLLTSLGLHSFRPSDKLSWNRLNWTN